MKKKISDFLSLFFIMLFLWYWCSVFFLSMPSNFAQKTINRYTPRLNTIFARPWQLFTPPPHYHQRLYLVTKSAATGNKLDSIELLENLSLKKQQAAPFNQSENLVEQIVNNNVSGLLYTIWTKKRMSQTSFPGELDSATVASAIARVAHTNNYSICLASLKNYGMKILKEKKSDWHFMEYKIIIKLKMIPPFKELSNQNYISKETAVFETAFAHTQ